MKYVGYLLTLFVLVVCAACEKEEEPIIDQEVGRTVLVYIAADNNLSGSVEGDLQVMEQGLLRTNMHKGNLLVYVDKLNQNPQLLRLVQEKDSVRRELIESYPIDHRSASPERLGEILRRATQAYPSDHYGLVLWSHGTAWLPYSYKSYLRSFGVDQNGNYMSINDLAATLADYHFDFLLFDACYMGSLEVAYALRHVTDYLIASPTEVLVDGFPYHLFMGDLFAPVVNAAHVGAQFYAYYEKSYGTVSVTQTAELDKLAAICRTIFKEKNEEELFAVPVNQMQLLEYLTGSTHALYDAEDYVRQLATEEQWTQFEDCLAQIVLYKATTPKSAYSYPSYAGGSYLPIERFCGLSLYVPQKELGDLNAWYRQLEWYQAVYQ